MTPTGSSPGGNAISPWTRWADSGGRRARCFLPRLSGSAFGPGPTLGQVPRPEGDLRRCGLRSKRLARLGQDDVWLDLVHRASSRGHPVICHSPKALDRGTHVRLATSLAKAQQGLRTPPPLQRNHDLHAYDRPHVAPPWDKRNLI